MYHWFTYCWLVRKTLYYYMFILITVNQIAYLRYLAWNNTNMITWVMDGSELVICLRVWPYKPSDIFNVLFSKLLQNPSSINKWESLWLKASRFSIHKKRSLYIHIICLKLWKLFMKVLYPLLKNSSEIN